MVDLREVDLAALNARTKITVLLLVGTVLISVVAGLSTYNYQQFFPALEQLRVSVGQVYAHPNSNSLNGSVTLTIENPTGYSGLIMQDILTNFTVTFTNTTTVPQGTIIYGGSIKHLDPTQEINITLPLIGSGDGPYRVTNLIKSGAVPQYAFSIILIVTTFLNQVLSITIPYQCSATTRPMACEQVGIIVAGKGEGPSSGGGR